MPQVVPFGNEARRLARMISIRNINPQDIENIRTSALAIQNNRNDLPEAIDHNTIGTSGYPDFYKLTPAYNLSVSGMSTFDHITSFINPTDDNFALKRAKRLMKEEKKIIYCDTLDTISTLASIFVLLMTLVITIWMLYADAKIQYVSKQENTNKSEVIQNLNSLESYWAWKYVKLILTAIPIIIATTNIYKRTTKPRKGTKIRNIEYGFT